MRARLVIGVDVIEDGDDATITSWVRAHEHVVMVPDCCVEEGLTIEEILTRHILDQARAVLSIPHDVVIKRHYEKRLGRGRCPITTGLQVPEFKGE